MRKTKFIEAWNNTDSIEIVLFASLAFAWDGEFIM